MARRSGRVRCGRERLKWSSCLPVRKSQAAAWDKRCPARDVYLGQETGRKRASRRFNPAFSVWLALGHIQ